jgi:hypothetical protein
MNHNDEFDDLLHDGLGEYREAEPLAGLEERVMQRLAAQSAVRGQGWWRWGLAAAFVAALVVAAWVVWRPTPPRPQVQQASSEQSVMTPVKVPAETAVAEVTPKQASRHVLETPPVVAPAATGPSVVEKRAMPAQFPTPTALSPEERAFMAALRRAPDSTSVAGEQDKAITIAEIEIKPLVIGGVTSSEDSGEKQ